MQDYNRFDFESDTNLSENKKEDSKSLARDAAAGFVGGAAITGGTAYAANQEIFNGWGESPNPEASEDKDMDTLTDENNQSPAKDDDSTSTSHTEPHVHQDHQEPEKPHDPFQDVIDILYHESEKIIPEPAPLPFINMFPEGHEPEPWPWDEPIEVMYAGPDPIGGYEPPIPIGEEEEDYFIIHQSQDPETNQENHFEPKHENNPENWNGPDDPRLLNEEIYAGPEGWEDITDDPTSLLEDPNNYGPIPDL